MGSRREWQKVGMDHLDKSTTLESNKSLDPIHLQRTSGRRITASALLLATKSPRKELPLPSHLCEVCLDVPAIRRMPAPWGGDMGVCQDVGQTEHIAGGVGASCPS